MTGAMFFSPNLTGPLHIGNAVVMWLTAREAQLRGLRFVICLDDYPISIDIPGHARPKPSVLDRVTTVQSCIAACELLGIENAEYHYRSSYVCRYFEVFESMLETGLVREVDATMYAPITTPVAEDAIVGTLCDTYDLVRACYCFGRPFVTLVDFFDFQVPLHIRGQDISHAAAPELRLWPLMCQVLGDRPPMEYAHIPQIARGDGTPLHKSALENSAARIGINEDNPYLFSVWATRFERKTPEWRRAALESIVLMPGKPYALSNIYPQPKTLLMYDAETHTVVQHEEKSARRRELERMGQWPN